MTEPSLWSFIANADIVVKCVMLILLAASIFSWAIILQRRREFGKLQRSCKRFQKAFWSGSDFATLDKVAESKKANEGYGAIFSAGYNEYQRLSEQQQKPNEVVTGTERAMRIKQSHIIDKLETHLSYLATVGSTSPYVGLFGTVWGIMSAFRALGTAQQASIAMVAPGIAEALIATAIGLLAAIPAVVAYNRFNNQLTRFENQFDTFQEEVVGILQREGT